MLQKPSGKEAGMAEIPIHAKVECSDGPGGESITVIVNPVTTKVTHLVVENKHAPDPTPRLVPVDHITTTSSDRILLRCTQAELAVMHPFVTTHYVQTQHTDYRQAIRGDVIGGFANPHMSPYAVPKRGVVTKEEERIPVGELAVRRGTRVAAIDGPIGEVGELLVDASSEHITHLVLLEGHPWGKNEITLPISAIDRLEDDTVYLKLDKQDIERLPSIPVKRPFGGPASQQIELVARVFDGPDKAEEALQSWEEWHRLHTFTVRNAAILVRDEDGKTSFKDIKEWDAKKGGLVGAIAGGLIGLLGGPVGAVVGALAGAGVGGAAAGLTDTGFSDKFLQELQEHLQPGTSAFIVLVEHDAVRSMADAMADLGGVVLQQTITDRLVAEWLGDSEPQA
jgi:uncharacterized membrane protein